MSVFLFEWDGRLLREIIHAPKTAEKPQGEAVTAAFAYDTKSERYVEIEMYDSAQWYASVAGTPTGGVFHWVDKATSETASRWDMTLPDQERFAIDSFDHPEDLEPTYHASCKRMTN